MKTKEFTSRIYVIGIFFIACLVLPLLSFAQFSYGIKAGFNLSNTRTEHGHHSHLKPAYHIGFTASYGLSKRFSLASDLLFSDKGFGTLSTPIHFYYISLPVVLRYALTSKLSIEGGGGVNYLVSAYGMGIDGHNENLEYMWGNKIDWELCAGIRYSFTSHIALSLRYEYGLSNVINRKSTLAVFKYKIIGGGDPILNPVFPTLIDRGFKDYNRNFQLSVCYNFSNRQKR